MRIRNEEHGGTESDCQERAQRRRCEREKEQETRIEQKVEKRVQTRNGEMTQGGKERERERRPDKRRVLRADDGADCIPSHRTVRPGTENLGSRELAKQPNSKIETQKRCPVRAPETRSHKGSKRRKKVWSKRRQSGLTRCSPGRRSCPGEHQCRPAGDHRKGAAGSRRRPAGRSRAG